MTAQLNEIEQKYIIEWLSKAKNISSERNKIKLINFW